MSEFKKSKKELRERIQELEAINAELEAAVSRLRRARQEPCASCSRHRGGWNDITR